MNFEVLFDDTFSAVISNSALVPVDRKFILSLINDFEDGNWRHDKFENFIWDNVSETSLSLSERASLINQAHSLLIAAAKNLRLTDKDGDISKGSELAEIVLYGVMKHYFKALPVVPKIFYKQNTQDNAKGADSVHIVLDGDDDFSLWFGEAKFYNSIEDARLNKVIESVANSLTTDKLKKENSIITNVNDLQGLIDNKVLLKKIIDSLSHKNSIDDLKSKIHIPILMLHECKITAGTAALTEKYRDELRTYQIQRANAYFSKQIQQIGPSVFLYEKIHFHLILFPVPNKAEIVDSFTIDAKFYKGKS